MRVFLGFLLIICCSGAFASDIPLGSWIAPNGKYVVHETFCGEGKRVIGVLKNIATGKKTTVFWHGARDLSASWSPDSHFVAINADMSKYADVVSLHRIERGKVTEIALLDMEAVNFLSGPAKEQLQRSGHLSFHGINAIKWHSGTEVEFVSSTEAVNLDGIGTESVDEHIIVKITRGEARILKHYRETQS